MDCITKNQALFLFPVNSRAVFGDLNPLSWLLVSAEIPSRPTLRKTKSGNPSYALIWLKPSQNLQITTFWLKGKIRLELETVKPL